MLPSWPALIAGCASLLLEYHEFCWGVPHAYRCMPHTCTPCMLATFLSLVTSCQGCLLGGESMWSGCLLGWRRTGGWFYFQNLFWDSDYAPLAVQALNDHHVLLEGTLLKPNMVSAGARPAFSGCPRVNVLQLAHIAAC